MNILYNLTWGEKLRRGGPEIRKKGEDDFKKGEAETNRKVVMFVILNKKTVNVTVNILPPT